jgi:DNA-binding NtrC family response regulator
MEFGRACREISERAAEILLHFPWPGNVRELRNVIRRAMLLASDVIEPDDLAFLSVGASPTVPLRGELPGHSSLKEIAGAAAKAEQQAIQRALEITMGNKSEAARLLRTDYKTLHLKMKNYGVDARPFRESHARGGSPV